MITFSSTKIPDSVDWSAAQLSVSCVPSQRQISEIGDKFYCLNKSHFILQAAGKNIRLCVMNNLLPRAIHMSEKYDLKGSTYKRKASKHELAKSSPTFKDLDFKDKNQDGIYLEADTYDALLKTMRRDCRVSIELR